ncbi:hypothetical protein EON65_05010 [archaeon]|nr:MAG: hypothetical protein EON65_05010 [archaeon]
MLYYETSQHISPEHKQVANVGIASSPCSFIIEKKSTSSQQSVMLVKGAFTLQSFYARPKVIRCKISDSKLFHLSTNLLILYPNQEQK